MSESESESDGESEPPDLVGSQSTAASSSASSSKDTDERGTPPWLIRLLQSALGGLFGLDPCAGAEACKIAHQRFTAAQNGLAQPWNAATVFINPPYSDIAPWLKKGTAELAREDATAPDLLLFLLPGNTSSDWFQTYAPDATLLCLIDKRISFVGTDHTPRFSSILLAYGDIPPALVETFDHLGTLYEPAPSPTTTTQTRLTPVTCASPTAAERTAEPAAPSPLTLDLDTVCINDKVTLEFDRQTLGFPSEIPQAPTVTVLNGTGRDHEESPAERSRITCIDPASDCWIALTEGAEDPSSLSCAVSPDGREWIDVRLRSVSHTSSGGPAAIAPYGPGTAYVC